MRLAMVADSSRGRASAAATAMTKNPNTCPACVPVWTRLNASSMNTTEFSMISIDMSWSRTLRRVRNPIAPMAKSNDASAR